ncbi:unnamed protein product, partial [Polarella glacialis]
EVEIGHICSGGTPSSADRCSEAGLFVYSALTLQVSGSRLPGIQEISSASIVALAKAIFCPQRDVEIVQVQSSADPPKAKKATFGTTTTTTTTNLATNASR